jgi:hypothetical protein
MMTSLTTKQAIAELSKRFEARYGYHWIASNDIDDRENLREKLLQWIDEIDKEKITPEFVLKITDIVLEKAEFSTFPPTLNRFIFICNEMKKMFNKGDSGKTYLAMKRLDERFSFTYGRLWTETDKDKSKRRLEYWRQELELEEINDKLIATTLNKIRGKVAYIQYPPTLNQFVMECHFERIGDDFTDSDLAFVNASNKEECIHITIKMTRQKIGSHTLKIGKEKYLKSLFEKIYLDECRAYVKDHENYLSKLNKQLAKNEESKIKEESVADNNSDFFNLLVKKSH